MRLVEGSTIGKRGDPRLNEDGIFFNDRWAAVIDGCSSAAPLPGSSRPSGVIARELLEGALTALDGNATYQQAFAAFNGAIAHWYEKMGRSAYFAEHPHQRPSAYMALVSAHRREVWILGDCQALIDGVLHTHHKRIDTLMEDLRTLFIEAALAQGATLGNLVQSPAVIDDQLRPIMALQPLFQNMQGSSPYAYSVLDGFFFDLEAVQCIALGDEPVEVILGTDGYPQLDPTLEQTEQSLARLLAEDPLCYRSIRSTKGVGGSHSSFDDRSYLRLIV